MLNNYTIQFKVSNGLNCIVQNVKYLHSTAQNENVLNCKIQNGLHCRTQIIKQIYSV